MSQILYFAYGSNMLEARLQQRCSCARAVGAARLTGWALRFDKRSMDGSGKATIEPVPVPSASVCGVLYLIDERELGDLDRFEGYQKGYDRCVVEVVQIPSGTRANAITYVADTSYLDVSLRPYDWYMDLIIAGAREHDLPESHIERLDTVLSVPDPDLSRATRVQAIALIQEASRA